MTPFVPLWAFCATKRRGEQLSTTAFRSTLTYPRDNCTQCFLASGFIFLFPSQSYRWLFSNLTCQVSVSPDAWNRDLHKILLRCYLGGGFSSSPFSILISFVSFTGSHVSLVSLRSSKFQLLIPLDQSLSKRCSSNEPLEFDCLSFRFLPSAFLCVCP